MHNSQRRARAVFLEVFPENTKQSGKNASISIRIGSIPEYISNSYAMLNPYEYTIK
jgi:hypothetical protein